jgi:hypothetical protein
MMRARRSHHPYTTPAYEVVEAPALEASTEAPIYESRNPFTPNL